MDKVSEQMAELAAKQIQLATASPAVLSPPPITPAPPTAPCNAPAAGGGIAALGWDGITVQKSGPHYRLVIAALTQICAVLALTLF